MGGVHDFSALVASIRNRGKSIANVCESVLGYRAKILFASFLWLSLVLVVAVFAAVTGNTLMTKPEIVIPTFGLILVAVFLGVMIYKLGMNQLISTIVGIAMFFGLILLGYRYPVTMPQFTLGAMTISPGISWTVILLVYAYIASVLPVNILLQPRDYLVTFLLYFALFFRIFGNFNFTSSASHASIC